MQSIFQRRLYNRANRRLYHDIKITTLPYSIYEKLGNCNVEKPKYITHIEPVRLYLPGIYFPNPDLLSYQYMWKKDAKKHELTQHSYYVANHIIYTHYIQDLHSKLNIKKYDLACLTDLLANDSVRSDLISWCRKDPWFSSLTLDHEKLSYETVLHHLKKEARIVDRLDMDGGTLLKSAVYCGFTTVIKLLIDNGTDIDHRCNLDYSVLHIAAIKGDYHIVKALLDLGIDKELKSRNGKTALDVAKMLREQIQLIPAADNMPTAREYARIVSLLER
uniref:Uncharacterized protein n=1 Tax=viral metagenome TaxID=1070528 RepID=A0A6C0C9S6_9ZZZZ